MKKMFLLVLADIVIVAGIFSGGLFAKADISGTSLESDIKAKSSDWDSCITYCSYSYLGDKIACKSGCDDVYNPLTSLQVDISSNASDYDSCVSYCKNDYLGSKSDCKSECSTMFSESLESNYETDETDEGGLPGANNTTTAKCGANFTEFGGVCFPTNTGLPNPQGGITQILSNIFSWLMGIFTTIAVMAFVVSGIQYLTSTGDEKQLEVAKRNAKYSLLGIIVGLSGFVLVKAIAAAISAQGFFF